MEQFGNKELMIMKRFFLLIARLLLSFIFYWISCFLFSAVIKYSLQSLDLTTEYGINLGTALKLSLFYGSYRLSKRIIPIPNSYKQSSLLTKDDVRTEDNTSLNKSSPHEKLSFPSEITATTELLEKRHTEHEEKTRELEELRLLAKQQKQAEERNLATQKRIGTTITANKRKKKKIAIIISIVVIIQAIIIAMAISADTYHGQLRNFATETMEDSFTNVYADVVFIEPKFYTYEKSTSAYERVFGNDSKKVEKLICRCKTVEGKFIWVTFFYQDYPGSNYSRNIDDYNTLTYSFQSPMRLIGKVDTANQVYDGLVLSLGDVFVLVVRDFKIRL